MWSYETTRAASLQTTSSYASSNVEEADGTQTLDGLTNHVTDRDGITASHRASHYGIAKVIQSSATVGYTFGATRNFSGPGEDDTWGTTTGMTVFNTQNGLEGTISVEYTRRTTYTLAAEGGGADSSSSEETGADTTTFDVGLTRTFNYTTTSTGVTDTYDRTTTATRTESYLRGNTGTYSTTTESSTTATTSTGDTTATTTASTTASTGASIPTTTSSSRSASYATSTTSTRTTSEVTYLSTSRTVIGYLDTVVIADWTDWLWFVTTTGTDVAESVGSSFTRTTFSEEYDAGSVSIMTTPYTGLGGGGPGDTWSIRTYSSTTTTSTVATTYASTYTTQHPAVVGGAISLSTTSTATLDATTTTSAKLIYDSTYSTESNGGYGGVFTFDILIGPDSTQTTITDTFVTTAVGSSTLTTSLTQTVWTYLSTRLIVVNTTSALNDPDFEATYSTGNSFAVASATISKVQNYAHSVSPGNLHYREPAIGRGFQDYRSMGYNQPYGTGYVGGSSLIGEWGLGFPGLFTPQLNTARVATTVNYRAMTVQFDSVGGILYTTTSSLNTDSQRVDATGSVEIALAGTRATSLTRLNTEGGNTVGGWGYDTATSRYTTLTNVTSANNSEIGVSSETATEYTNTSSSTSTYTEEVESLSNTYTTTAPGAPGETLTVTEGDPYDTTVTLTATSTTGVETTITNTEETASSSYFTQHPGIHRVTSQDSAHSSSAYYESWTQATKTSSILRSDWLAYESVAAIYSDTRGTSGNGGPFGTSSETAKRWINFSAYPDA